MTHSKDIKALSDAQISEVIDYAWDDDASFDWIKERLGITEPQVIKIMQGNLKPGSFRLWRKRVSGRTAKHKKLMRPKDFNGRWDGEP